MFARLRSPVLKWIVHVLTCYRGERIAYELALQELQVVYNGFGGERRSVILFHLHTVQMLYLPKTVSICIADEEGVD